MRSGNMNTDCTKKCYGQKPKLKKQSRMESVNKSWKNEHRLDKKMQRTSTEIEKKRTVKTWISKRKKRARK